MRSTASAPGAAPAVPALDGRGGAAPALAGWRGLAAALAAGLVLAAAFPPLGVWPLAVAGPALFTVAIWGKGRAETFGLSLACAAAFFVPLLSWLVNVAWYAWAALAIAESVSFALLALCLRPLLRLRCWPAAVAGWWVVTEAVRTRWPWSFPWGRLAMSQPSAPTAGWAGIGGPPLLTFLLALTGACLAWVVLTVARPASRAGHQPTGGVRPGRAGARAAGTLALLAAGLTLAGNLVLSLTTASPAAGGSAVVATVQGNVPHSRNLPQLLRESTVTGNHAAATISLANQVRAGLRPAPDVVIWPENSTDLDPAYSPAAYATIAAAVHAIGRPVLVGAVLVNPLRNSGQLWLPGRGPVAEYTKRQLVPFGEVIPLRGLLQHVTSLTQLQPRNFTPGHRAVVFRIGAIRLGDVICYEVGFDNLVRSEVLAGANLLTVQTNDADFELDGQLGETLQQLDMARMDAITTGRSVAVASTTGISAIIAPDGTVLARSGTWQRAVLEARVPLRSQLTPADTAEPWIELAIVTATALALAWAVGAGIAARRQRTASSPRPKQA